jgi:hypothetical protein
MTMKKLITAGLLLLTLTACDGYPSGDRVEAGQQADITGALVGHQPIPDVGGYSQMRQNLIEIERAEALGVQTTSFMFNRASPDPIQSCPSIGVPIPNTASLSNPHQVVWGNGGGSGVVDQMDPNGIYVPASSSGTFVQCVGPDGHVAPAYAEGEVQSVFGPATWDRATHSIVLTGPSTFKFSASKGK